MDNSSSFILYMLVVSMLWWTLLLVNVFLVLKAQSPQRITIHIAALLPLSSQSKYMCGVASRSEMAINTALDEINQHVYEPPRNYKLLQIDPTFYGNSSAAATLRILRNTSTTEPIAALIEQPYSRTALASALIASEFGIPQCSFTPSPDELDDKEKYPTTFRTVPSLDMYAALVMATSKQFGWTRMALLYSTDEIGSSFREALDLHIQNATTAVEGLRAFAIEQDASIDALRDTLRTLGQCGVKAIILAGNRDMQEQVLRVAYNFGNFSSPRQEWLTLNNVTGSLLDITKATPEDMILFEGMFMLRHIVSTTSPAYNNFKQRWHARVRSKNHTLRAPSINDFLAYNCAHLLALGIDQYINNNLTVLQQVSRGQYPINYPINISLFNSHDNTTPPHPNNIIFVDHHGDIASGVELLNLQYHPGSPACIAHPVATYQAAGMIQFSHMDNIRRPSITDPRNDVTMNIHTTGGKVMCALCILGILACFTMMITVLLKRKDPLVRAMSPLFTNLMLCGIVLIYLSDIFWLYRGKSYLWSPSAAFTCHIVATGIILGNLIAKNQRIWQLFASPYLFKHGLPDAQIFRVSLVLMGIDGILAGLYASQVTHVYVRVQLADGTYFGGYDNDLSGQNPTPLIICICLYNAGLISYAALLAWNTRKIPIKEYNESRAIALTLYSFCLAATLFGLSIFMPDDLLAYSFYIRTATLWFYATFLLIVFHWPILTTLSPKKSKVDLGADIHRAIARTASPQPIQSLSASTDARAELRASNRPRQGISPTGDVDPFMWVSSIGTTRNICRPSHLYDRTSATTHAPSYACECFEGVLFMQRSYLLTSTLANLLGCTDRWRIVKVTVLPHRRKFTVQERSDMSYKQRVEGFSYTNTLGPEDIARQQEVAREQVLASRILPSSRFYTSQPKSNTEVAENKTAASEHTFVVETSQYKFTFQCETPAEVHEWVNVFKLASENNPWEA